MVLDSVNECVVCSAIAKRQNYISAAIENQLREKLVELSKMITSFQNTLKIKTKL